MLHQRPEGRLRDRKRLKNRTKCGKRCPAVSVSLRGWMAQFCLIRTKTQILVTSPVVCRSECLLMTDSGRLSRNWLYGATLRDEMSIGNPNSRITPLVGISRRLGHQFSHLPGQAVWLRRKQDFSKLCYKRAGVPTKTSRISPSLARGRKREYLPIHRLNA